MGSLAVPLVRVVLGPGESAVVGRGAVHDAAVIVVLGLASIAEVEIVRVDGRGDSIASALGRRMFL